MFLCYLGNSEQQRAADGGPGCSGRRAGPTTRRIRTAGQSAPSSPHFSPRHGNTGAEQCAQIHPGVIQRMLAPTSRNFGGINLEILQQAVKKEGSYYMKRAEMELRYIQVRSRGC
jgi:hypothetical protein